MSLPLSLPRRARLRAALVTIVAALLAVTFTTPAQAVDYRFWGFYQLVNGSWAFAEKGSDQTVPEDGTVEGWRFAVSGADSSRFPRDVLTFDELCGSTPASAGSKRVGLVVDYGRAADSAEGTTPPEPKALCAVVPTDASSTDVLKEAGELRSENGIVCAVGGYPASDCGGEVKEVSAEAKAPDTPIQIAAPAAAAADAPATSSTSAETSAETQDGSVTAYVIAGIALLALLAFLLVRSRSRRTA